ncbi:hypothetical protein B0H13DRAFT_1864947 [Mycena leptocephala]|nr:hypothetical protein B0H13DRAFT_1864947 [Mycena leptocephala]
MEGFLREQSAASGISFRQSLSTLKEAGFPELPTFEVGYKDRVKRGERMMGCSGCKASHYCSKECQLESWKAQPMPHRRFCPVLKKIFQVHESLQHTAMSGRTDFSSLYQSSGISTKDIGETIKYVITLMEHFSEYKD